MKNTARISLETKAPLCAADDTLRRPAGLSATQGH